MGTLEAGPRGGGSTRGSLVSNSLGLRERRPPGNAPSVCQHGPGVPGAAPFGRKPRRASARPLVQASLFPPKANLHCLGKVGINAPQEDSSAARPEHKYR